MKRAQLAGMLDHSVLKPEATTRDVLDAAQIVRDWRIGFYCVQPARVRMAAQALAGCSATLISVVGFPHGCELPATKAEAAALAVADGAGEIDMVMNFGLLRSGDPRAVADDIEAVVRAVPGISASRPRAASAALPTPSPCSTRAPTGWVPRRAPQFS